MNIEIVDALGNRLGAVATMLHTEMNQLIHAILWRGLLASENRNEVRDSRTDSSVIVNYIQDNWETQSDDEMATTLKISVKTVSGFRCALGLYRPDGRRPIILTSSVNDLVGSIASEAKMDIAVNPKLSHVALAINHHLAPLTVKLYRLELLVGYLKTGNWQAETDGAVGKKFGLSDQDVLKVRSKMRLLKNRGHNATNSSGRSVIEKYIAQLGGKEAIKKSLTEDGYTKKELFSRAGIIHITKQRGYQILGAAGLSADPNQRTTLWYANRLLGHSREKLAAQLASKEGLEALLAKSGGLSALGRQMGIYFDRLNYYINRFMPLVDKKLLRTLPEMVRFHCSLSSCKRKFWIAKSRVQIDKRHNPKKKLWFCCKKCQGRFLALGNVERRKQVAR